METRNFTVSLLSVNINCENRNIKGMTWISHLLSIFSVMFSPTWGLEGSGDLSSPDKTSPVVSRLPPFLLGLFHYSGVNLYANGSASCPLSAGARVGFPHSCRLTPPTPPLPLPQLCLISPFDPSLPSGVRGYLSQPVASFVFAQPNHHQSAYVVFLINGNRFRRLWVCE